MEQYTFLTAEESELFLSSITDDTLRERLRGHYLHAAHLVCTLVAEKVSSKMLKPYFKSHRAVGKFLHCILMDGTKVEITYPDDNTVQWKGEGKALFKVDIVSQRMSQPWSMRQ
jgi:hypothetical protein